LVDFTNWRKWEGKLDIFTEEEAFANQKERVRRLHLLKENKNDGSSFFLSVFNIKNELISLLELYKIDLELFSPNWILKKTKDGNLLALEAGKLLINHFFSDLFQINTIIFDLPIYRTESRKILEHFGFYTEAYYFKMNNKNEWQKILLFQLHKKDFGRKHEL
jgi:RimJ/RimL family protein N-acetyltransferase